MFNTRGYLRTCLLLLLAATLTVPWGVAGASWSESAGLGVAPPADINRAAGVHLQHSLPAGQEVLTNSLVSGEQGPNTWQTLNIDRITHPDLEPPLDDTVQPERTAGTCTVSSTSDSGPNTLRQCLLDAVAGDDILFNPATFPPGSPATITLASELPLILVDNLTIDASDAGVILDGSVLGSDPNGLVIYAAQGVTVRGMQIQGFDFGVVLTNGATYNTVGGDRSIGAGPIGQGNLISANETVGVQIQRAGTAHNSIIGNLIGTDITGATENGNGYAGIVIADEAAHNVIGGANSSETCDGPCNLISGNQVIGVQIQDVGSDGNQVLGNFVGTDLTGSNANGNSSYGIGVFWGASQNAIGGARSPGVCDGPCNLISGNVNVGVSIEDEGTTNNKILGNFIGTNASGNAALANFQGVVIATGASDNEIGGVGAGEGNLISGNTNFGIWVSWPETTGNQVLGNIIGTDISGVTALPNHRGVLIAGSTSNQIGGAAVGAGNLISGNENSGIWMEYLSSPGNTVAGNKIGTNMSGTGAVPNYYGIIHVVASNNQIGGTEPGAGNLISGNAQAGLHIENSTLNSVQGNIIGADVTGEVAIPNLEEGVFIGFGASNNTIGGGNLISGNGDFGIFIQNEESVGNKILGNRIGTNKSGSSSLPNDYGVVLVSARETIIGGADTSTPWICDGPCNLISGNNSFGVSIQGVSADVPGQTSQWGIDRPLLADQNNQVLGNFIGTDLTGTSAVPNLAGVDLSYQATGNLVGGSSTLGEGNLISGNQRDGVVVRHPLTDNNQISGNRIGSTANGGASLANDNNGIWITEGASNNTVGGDGAGVGNQISGQAADELYFGVFISTNSEPKAIDNQVISNRIGTNAAGTGAVPNGGGVGLWDLVTGTIIRDNVISGNSLRGILILETTGNEVRDNKIGVAADGMTALPNSVYGIVLVTAPDNLIGPGNTIAYNQVGVAVVYPESVGNTITQNSIYGNSHSQIEFFEVPQPLAPAPTITGWDEDTNTVSGSACAGCQVEVFNNWLPRSGGKTYLSTTAVAGDGKFSLAVGPGHCYLAATATDGDGTTSEFSDSLNVGTCSSVFLPLTAKNTGQ